jgi:hypothetical protein
MITTRRKIMRAALIVALLVLTAVLAWVAWTKLSTGQGGAQLVLPVALLSLAAAGLLFLRRNRGGVLAILAGTLAIFAALFGALVGLALSYCVLCSPQPPLSAESVALWVVAVVVLALVLADLASLGLLWVVIAIAVPILVLAGGVGIVAAAVLVAAVVLWLILKRRVRTT